MDLEEIRARRLSRFSVRANAVIDPASELVEQVPMPASELVQQVPVPAQDPAEQAHTHALEPVQEAPEPASDHASQPALVSQLAVACPDAIPAGGGCTFVLLRANDLRDLFAGMQHASRSRASEAAPSACGRDRSWSPSGTLWGAGNRSSQPQPGSSVEAASPDIITSSQPRSTGTTSDSPTLWENLLSSSSPPLLPSTLRLAISSRVTEITPSTCGRERSWSPPCSLRGTGNRSSQPQPGSSARAASPSPDIFTSSQPRSTGTASGLPPLGENLSSSLSPLLLPSPLRSRSATSSRVSESAPWASGREGSHSPPGSLRETGNNRSSQQQPGSSARCASPDISTSSQSRSMGTATGIPSRGENLLSSSSQPLLPSSLRSRSSTSSRVSETTRWASGRERSQSPPGSLREAGNRSRQSGTGNGAVPASPGCSNRVESPDFFERWRPRTGNRASVAPVERGNNEAHSSWYTFTSSPRASASSSPARSERADSPDLPDPSEWAHASQVNSNQVSAAYRALEGALVPRALPAPAPALPAPAPAQKRKAGRPKGSKNKIKKPDVKKACAAAAAAAGPRAATSCAAQFLRTTRVQNHGWMCPICKEDYGEPKVTTQCGHAFHRHCVEAWLDDNEICPMCTQVAGELRDFFG